MAAWIGGGGAHQRATAADQGVGGELGRPMAVGQQGETAAPQPVAAARGTSAQAGGGGEQLLDRRHAHQAGAGEGGVVDLVPVQPQADAAGPLRRRMELPAGLEHQHRLDPRRGARGRHEPPGVGDALEMDQDGTGGEIERQIVENVAELDLGELAERGDPREADVLRRGPLQHRRGDRIGLGDEGEVARRRHRGRRTGVEPAARDDHAHPVGPDQAQPVGARRLAGGTGLLAVQVRLPRPAADQCHRTAAAGGELGQECGEVGLRQADDGEARLGRQPRQAFEPRLGRRPPGAAQRQDRAGKAGIPQVGLRDLRPARRVALRPDPEDPLGLEQMAQAA